MIQEPSTALPAAAGYGSPRRLAYHAIVTIHSVSQLAADVAQPAGLELAAFRGVRYATHRLSDPASVTAPPYDLVGDEEAQRLRSADPHNVVRLIRPRDEGDADPYESARDTLRRWLSEGVLATDADPALYVYEEQSAAGTWRGLLGGVRLARPEAGVILPHEDTTPAPIADRLRLTRATEANLEPIFLLYEGGGPTNGLLDEVAQGGRPVFAATTEQGVSYRLWAVTAPRELARVGEDLHRRTALIADGHHRYAASLRFQADQHAAGRGPGPWDYGLAMLVDASAYPPRLGAVHRVLPALSSSRALHAARRAFRVTSLGGDRARALGALADAAREGPAFLLGGDGSYQLLTDPDHDLLDRTLPAERSGLWRRLSTSVLHHLLIPAVWGLDDDEGSVKTVHNDAVAACRLAESSGGTAVLLHPLEVGDVLAVAREGERVPRKSTSFGPKPRTGLVLRRLDAG